MRKIIHFIGIKGVAMTGLAIIAKQKGYKVTGSDVDEEFVTDVVLKRNGIAPILNFSSNNLKNKPSLVVVTGAHGGINNPEAKASINMGIRTIMQGQALGEFMNEKIGVAICGCHGKTTTTAIVSTILEFSGLDPSFVVGTADVPALKNPAKNGQGKFFIGEADEYITCPGVDTTPKFMWLNPQTIVMTSIDYDHPDAYKSIDEVKAAYLNFARKLPENGVLIACADDENIKSIIKNVGNRIITYGISALADLRPVNITFEEEVTYFSVFKNGFDLGRFTLHVPGIHNVLNATAAIACAIDLGVDLEKIRTSLSKFNGTKRRFEKVGEKNGIRIIDDYAHHPTEIEATIKGAKKWFNGSRITIIFQPHTYSRTKALLDQFSKCFTAADEVIITDIYSSKREQPDPGINSKILSQAISKNQRNVKYIAKTTDVIKYLGDKLVRGDTVITMGAGDIYKIAGTLLNNIQ